MMGTLTSRIVAALVLAAGIATGEPPATLEFTDGDHKLVTMWMGTLKSASDQLDDCTYKGAFANADRVPDICNGAFTGGGALVEGHDKEGLPFVMHRNCAKWRPGTRSERNKNDCEQLGSRYWHLAEAIDRATIANGVASERQKTVDLGSAATDYVSKVNPMEVKGHRELLHQINDALEKPNPNPGMAFQAGQIHAELEYWLLHHCPSELAWGIPTKPYTTAISECAALEPELQRFEVNMLKLMEIAAQAGETK